MLGRKIEQKIKIIPTDKLIIIAGTAIFISFITPDKEV